MALRWSGCLWQSSDPGPGGGDGLAQGQVAGILSRRLRRPPRTSFPVGVQDPAQSLWFCFGQVAVQGDKPLPGQQGRGEL